MDTQSGGGSGAGFADCITSPFHREFGLLACLLGLKYGLYLTLVLPSADYPQCTYGEQQADRKAAMMIVRSQQADARIILVFVIHAKLSEADHVADCCDHANLVQDKAPCEALEPLHFQ